MSDPLVDVLFLLALSLVAFVIGLAFRAWPQKIQDYSLTLDGSIFFLGAAVHLRLVRFTGTGLIVGSAVAFVAAASKI